MPKIATRFLQCLEFWLKSTQVVSPSPAIWQLRSTDFLQIDILNLVIETIIPPSIEPHLVPALPQPGLRVRLVQQQHGLQLVALVTVWLVSCSAVALPANPPRRRNTENSPEKSPTTSHITTANHIAGCELKCWGQVVVSFLSFVAPADRRVILVAAMKGQYN